MSGLRARAAAMLERVRIEAESALGLPAAAGVCSAVAAALALRDARIEDDHDPRYLHPARTVRILLADTALRDAQALAAAALVDSVDADLAAAHGDVGGAGALADSGGELERAVALAAGIPLPWAADAGMLERLVTAEPALAAAALAERLDQARHLHLRADLDWPAFHASIRREYIPAAQRISPPLARRLERWADAFERRLLLRG